MSDAAVIPFLRAVPRAPDPVAPLIHHRHALVARWSDLHFDDPVMPILESEIERIDEALIATRAADLDGCVARARQVVDVLATADPEDTLPFLRDVLGALCADLEGLAQRQFGVIAPRGVPAV